MRRSGPGTLLAAMLALAAGGAVAHDLGTTPVHPILDPPSATLRDVTIEVAETLAPQVLLANHGPELLTIIDNDGRPFVRIGPAGVEADLNAASWYESLSTAAMPEPAAAHDPHSPARWVRVSSARSFGWFDKRLAVGTHAPTAAMRAADAPASTGEWRIPVRLGGVSSAIAGHFEYQPPPDGVYVTRLAPPRDFPAGIQLLVSQGAIPAILLMDTGHHDIVLIGLQGEDEVRVGGQGVAVNTGSVTWRQWGQQARTPLDDGPARWMTISRGASYSWLEKRGQTRADGEAHPDARWVLPLRINGTGYDVEGVATWQDTERKDVAAR